MIEQKQGNHEESIKALKEAVEGYKAVTDKLIKELKKDIEILRMINRGAI